jgi:nucleoside-diphosphate-sugar epimerase
MKILVTGATGFIGGHLVNALIDKGYEVRCLVRKTSNVMRLKNINAELIYGDITELDSLEKALDGIDVVYHLAAITGETTLPFNKYWEINVQGTKNILETACRKGIKQFIFISTIGVLGWPKILPANEESPCNPAGKYHSTKYEAEKLVLNTLKTKRIQGTIIRPVMSYGDAEGFLFNLAKLIKTGKFMRIGRGENHLHLVSVDNLVQGLILVINNPNAMGKIFIIADDQPITLNNLLMIVSKKLNITISKFRVPIWIASPIGRAFDSMYSIFGKNNEPIITSSKVALISKNRFYDISRAKRELGYNPSINTEDSIKQTLELFVNSGKV